MAASGRRSGAVVRARLEGVGGVVLRAHSVGRSPAHCGPRQRPADRRAFCDTPPVWPDPPIAGSATTVLELVAGSRSEGGLCPSWHRQQ